MNSDDASTRVTILRTWAVCNRLGVCRQTLLRWRREGMFPEPRQLGPRSVGWPVEEIEAWIAARPRSTREAAT